jgi:hypothetical protein
MNGLRQASELVVRVPARVFGVLMQWFRGTLTTRQVVRIAMRVTRFDRWGVRPITQARFIALNEAAVQLSSMALEEPRRQAAYNVELRARLDKAAREIEHLRRVEAAYRQGTSRLDDLEQARQGVQAFMNAVQGLLFGVRGDTYASQAAAASVLKDRPAADCLATLINMSEGLHGARPFQYALPILSAERPFPLPWPRELPALRVVDIGSQELATEPDIHAPLRDGAPVEIIGFDPFARPAAGAPDDEYIDVIRADGARIKTFPTLLADGVR